MVEGYFQKQVQVFIAKADFFCKLISLIIENWIEFSFFNFQQTKNGKVHGMHSLPENAVWVKNYRKKSTEEDQRMSILQGNFGGMELA